MADILGTSGLTYNGKETTDILIKPAFQDPDFTKIFRVMTDIQSKQKMYLLNPLSKVTKLYNSCGLDTVTGSQINITQKELEVSPLQIYLNECPDVFSDTVFETLRKSGHDWNNLEGTQLETVITNIVMDAVKRDAWRILFFGDTGSVSTDYNQLDGFWTKIFEGVDTYCVDRVDNIGTSLTPGQAITILRNLYEQANNILKQIPETQKKFFVTGSIADNLLASYTGNTGGIEGLFLNLQNGVPQLKFYGIEVVPMRSWDTYISSDLGNQFPHRAVYTTPDNHVIGLEKASDMTTFKFWYSHDDDINKMLVRYRMGYQFVHCDLTAVSY